MKKIYYLCLAIGFMFSSVTFVSCGSDDGGKSNPENSNSGQDSNPQKTADRDETGNLKISEANFPDKSFRNYLLNQGYGSDGVLTNAEIAGVSQMDVRSKGIQSLKGIEYFTALTSLYCFANQLTSLDVSKNTALTRLICYSNQLTSLDVSKNTKLTTLFCTGNQLTSLDLSKNTALKELLCYWNQLTSLDVSKNTALTRLECNGNQLSSLNLSGCTALVILSCYGNQLTSLDVSGNTKLTELLCYDNQLTSLDVSKNTALTHLYCYDNQLTSLDVSGCTALTELDCYNNQIKGAAMDALVESLPTVSSGYMRVIYAVNEGNVMTKTQVRAARAKGWTPMVYYSKTSSWIPCGWEDGIDVVETNFPDKSFREYLLSTDYGVDGVLTDRELKNVIQINVTSQEIQSLQGIEYFTALEWLSCTGNQLTSLDVSKNTALTDLLCYNNQLTSLDVSGCTALEDLYCYDNQLTSLDVSKNAALTKLDSYNNQITSLDVTKNTKLTYLNCDPSVTVTGWPK